MSDGSSPAAIVDAAPRAPLVARVVPDLTGLDRHFDYLVPESMQTRVHIGTLVRITLNGRRVGGWVIALGPADPGRDPASLLSINKVTGMGPAQDVIDLASWAVHRWAGRLRSFLVAGSPAGAVLQPPSPHHGGAVPEPTDPLARLALERGGGVLRLPPAADVLPAVLAACRLGPTLVVAPAVAQARLLASRLRRSGRTVALLPNEWAAAAGGVDVVIGARAAVWAPCRGLASIIVVDEHDEGLQEERQPTWHARDVALERGSRAGVPVLLVSPCPSATAVATVGVERVVKPSINDERSGWPIVEIVDRTRDEPWQRSLATSPLIRQLRDADRRVVCVINTTGRARLLACRRCKTLQRCERCEAAVAQRDDEHFECARCGTVRPPVCQACGASAFAALRVGVTRLRDELQAAAARPVIAVTGKDSDTEPVPDAGVYIGTEAVLHRVRHADTVAFLDFDAELLAPRYRATEQAMTLLARAARLVGGRAGNGRILVQTFLPKHEVLDAVLHADPGRLLAKELERRRLLGFPPAAALAVVTGAGAEDYAAVLRLAGVQTGATLTGSVLLRAPTWDLLGDAIAATPRPKGSRLRIEVDPPRL
ncbi:MAG: priA [Ilumatobacteraceae bacterium]|nr:priA [Ilumatobacteraceae bacterium]